MTYIIITIENHIAIYVVPTLLASFEFGFIVIDFDILI